MAADGVLRLGALGTSSTRRVEALLHNDAPATLCVHELSTDLAGATLALQACAHLRDPAPDHACVSTSRQLRRRAAGARADVCPTCVHSAASRRAARGARC